MPGEISCAQLWFMNAPLINYLRTHRRQCGLTQTEVAHLLGLESGQVVSRHELRDRYPSLETLLGYQILFDALPHDLYPGVYKKVENLIQRRVRFLIDEFDNDLDDRSIAYKRQVLGSIFERIETRCPRL